MKWGWLVLRSCESASSGAWEHAVPAGAAIEILGAALELFDDLEDGDALHIKTRRERAQATNVACGLLIVSHICLLRLDQHVQAAGKASRALKQLLSAALRIGAGQHLDLANEGRINVPQDQCLEIASLKSAELVKCACEIGASLGTDDERLIELYARFGWHLGMYSQIMNDIEGIRSTEAPKSDLARLKATLPISFWLGSKGSTITLARNIGTTARRDGAGIREVICRSGALHYAWVVADIHRQSAEEILLELDAVRPASHLLGQLVQPTEPDTAFFQ
ncbi:MAG: polyprenyl synthetase family protein [Chloroflexi bacterium]|nr:polyprenyl synthetase family protein [Chloroflexota bacterium]